MANLFSEAPKILEIQDYKDSSKCELRLESDVLIKEYINRTEALIIEKITLPDPMTTRLKQAVMMIVDRVYLQDNKKGKEIIEEKDENHTRKYKLNDKDDIFTDEINELLRPYLKGSASNTGGLAKAYRS